MVERCAPCPFCGGAATAYEERFSNGSIWRVECDADTCGVVFPGYGSEGATIKAWNARTALSQPNDEGEGK